MPSYPLQTHETSWNPNRSSLQRHRKDGASYDDDDDDRDAVRCGADDDEVDDRVWRGSACLHDDEIMSAKAFAFIMYNILFHSLSLSLSLCLLFFSFS